LGKTKKKGTQGRRDAGRVPFFFLERFRPIDPLTNNIPRRSIMGISGELRSQVEKIAHAARDPETIDKKLFQVQVKILAKAVLELEAWLKDIATKLRLT
jgi:hypothetical protein